MWRASAALLFLAACAPRPVEIDRADYEHLRLARRIYCAHSGAGQTDRDLRRLALALIHAYDPDIPAARVCADLFGGFELR